MTMLRRTARWMLVGVALASSLPPTNLLSADVLDESSITAPETEEAPVSTTAARRAAAKPIANGPTAFSQPTTSPGFTQTVSEPMVTTPTTTPIPAAESPTSPWSEEWTDESCDDCIPAIWSHWTVNLDAVFFDRSTPDGLRLATSNPGGVEPDAAQMNFDLEAGPRLALIRRGISGWDLEINYMGIEGWDARLDLANTNDPRVPGAAAGGLFASNLLLVFQQGVRFDYLSRMHNEELNFRRALNDTWTALIGFRALQIHENLHAYTDAGRTFFYSVETDNRLYGIQIGGEGRVLCMPNFQVTTTFKAGLFENNSEQSTTDFLGSLSNNLPPYVLDSSTNQASFVGEIGILGTYRISETILLRAGYNMMWVDDVSLATEQIAVNDFPSFVAAQHSEIRSDGSLFYHGAVVGMELTW